MLAVTASIFCLLPISDMVKCVFVCVFFFVYEFWLVSVDILFRPSHFNLVAYCQTRTYTFTIICPYTWCLHAPVLLHTYRHASVSVSAFLPTDLPTVVPTETRRASLRRCLESEHRRRMLKILQDAVLLGEWAAKDGKSVGLLPVILLGVSGRGGSWN